MPIDPFQSYTPKIASSVYIADSALIIGRTELDEDCSVWPMAVIRGDMNLIRIGKRTNIQDGSILHITHDSPYSPGGSRLEIGTDVTVGHRAVLHACQIQDRCLIGIGAIVLDKAILEEEVMLGAGSLVPPGKVLESRHLYVGSPIKKIRPLTEKEIHFLKYSAKNYVNLKNAYQKKPDVHLY